MLAGYAKNTQQLLELQRSQSHPLVEILLYNNTIQTLLLDEKINSVLRNFCQWKVDLNREISRKFAGELEAKCQDLDDIEVKETKISNEKEIKAMTKRMAGQEDFTRISRPRSAISQKELARQQKEEITASQLWKQQFQVPAIKQKRRVLTHPENPKLQVKRSVLNQSRLLNENLEKLANSVNEQQIEVEKMVSSMNESKSIAQEFENELFDQEQQLRNSNIIMEEKDDGRINEISSIDKPQSASTDEQRFDTVLDAAYNVLIDKFKSKKEALAQFENNQDIVLQACQTVMKMDNFDQLDVEKEIYLQMADEL